MQNGRGPAQVEKADHLDHRSRGEGRRLLWKEAQAIGAFHQAVEAGMGVNDLADDLDPLKGVRLRVK